MICVANVQSVECQRTTLCFEVIEALSWTIKTAREISRIRFSFVTISYRQYNICMVNLGFIRNIE